MKQIEEINEFRNKRKPVYLINDKEVFGKNY